jgi:hypothetical protein
MTAEIQENDVQEEKTVDLTSFEAALKDVVNAIEGLAKVYNDLSEEQQDEELTRIHGEYPYVHEMIVLLLRRWPMMPQ